MARRPLPADLAARARALRAAGLSQEAIALRLGCSQSLVSRRLRGHSPEYRRVKASVGGTKAAAARRAGSAHADHPASAERYYDAEETAFLAAVAQWRSDHGGRLPTNCDLLTVLKGLGYHKD